MKQREIIIRVVDGGNVSLASLRVEYKNQEDVVETLQRVLPMLNARGQMKVEMLTFPLKLNGVNIQQGKNK